MRADPALAVAWLAGEGIEVDEDLFAELGYAPFAYTMGAEPLASLVGAFDANMISGIAKNEPISAIEFLSRWYRLLVVTVAAANKEGDKHRAAALLGFADQVADARRQLMTSNAANQTLLFEELVHRYRKVAS